MQGSSAQQVSGIQTLADDVQQVQGSTRQNVFETIFTQGVQHLGTQHLGAQHLGAQHLGTQHLGAQQSSQASAELVVKAIPESTSNIAAKNLQKDLVLNIIVPFGKLELECIRVFRILNPA